ncbi:hypothetical protein EDB87DRAFT_1612195 [Lactarius vividus]|nr:hypothetical protein EDB87DRAFT_1612195 [Lactarius vividus]
MRPRLHPRPLTTTPFSRLCPFLCLCLRLCSCPLLSVCYRRRTQPEPVFTASLSSPSTIETSPLSVLSTADSLPPSFKPHEFESTLASTVDVVPLSPLELSLSLGEALPLLSSSTLETLPSLEISTSDPRLSTGSDAALRAQLYPCACVYRHHLAESLRAASFITLQHTFSPVGAVTRSLGKCPCFTTLDVTATQRSLGVTLTGSNSSTLEVTPAFLVKHLPIDCHR